MQQITTVLGLVATLILTLSSPAQAQGWEYGDYRENGVFNFKVSVSEDIVSLGCIGIYPSGDPIMLESTGSTIPYTLNLEFDYNRVLDWVTTPSGQVIRTDIVMVSGGKGFRLPKIVYNEMDGGWEVPLTFNDPLVLEILNNGGLEVRDNTGVLVTLPTQGLALNLAQAMVTCDTHWRMLGGRIPENLRPLIHALQGWSGVVITPAQPHSEPMISQTTQMPQSSLPAGAVMAALLTDAKQSCSGGAPEFEQNAIWQSDFDQDGIPDLVFDWRHVKCLTGTQAGLIGGGFCGAAHCSIDAFLSSRVAAGLPKVSLLAIGFGVEAAHPTDIMLGLGINECHQANLEPDCYYRLRWDGSDFNDPAN